MKAILIIIIVSIFLTSCSAEKVQSSGNNCQLEVVSSLTPDSLLFEEHRAVILETNDNSLLSGIDKIIEWNNVFYILDRRMKQIVLFDTNGKYLNRVHRVGNGPGEYVDLFDMALDKEKSTLLLLASPSSLHFYSLEGKYIDSQSLSGYYSSLSVVDEYIYLENATYVNDKQSDTSITVLHGKDRVELLKSQEEIAPYCVPRGYSLNETGLFTRRFDDTIYRLNERGVRSEYVVDFDVEQFPKDSKNKIYECGELSEYTRKNALVYSMTDLLETEDRIIFRTNLFEGLYLLDKNEQKVMHYKRMMNTDYNFPLSNYMPIYGAKDCICFINKAPSLYSMKKLCMDNPSFKEKLLPSFVSLLQNVDEDSNPILFYYKIKK